MSQNDSVAVKNKPVERALPGIVEGFIRRVGKPVLSVSKDASAPTTGAAAVPSLSKDASASPASAAPRQRGAVLVVALIFLLLLSILAVSIMRSGQLEVLMAGNSQAQLSAFEFAEGVSDSILARWSSNLQSSAVICGTCTSSSSTNCATSFSPTPSDAAFTCSTAVYLALDDRLNPGKGAAIPGINNATVQGRVRPLKGGKHSCVPSFIQGYNQDAWAFFFDVEASYDNSASRQGTSRVNQGVVLVNPVGIDCAKPSSGNLDEFAHVPTS